MKPLILLTLTFSVFFGALTPSVPLAQAQDYDSFYEGGGPTVTDGSVSSGGFVPCSGASCSLCDFAVMANTIIKWLIGIIFLFFAILAVVAGFKLVTSGTSGGKQAAKSSFTNAFIGLFIVLAAWILIDTLLRAVLRGGNGEVNGYGPWSVIVCASQVVPTVQRLAVDDQEFDLAEPADTTVYSGTSTPSGGTGNNCTPIPDSQLVAFPASATYGGTEKALRDTVERFVAMRADAARSGIDLKVSDGYRSPEEQLSAWNGNRCRLVNGRASCAVRTAAVPCSLGGRGSNHTSGTAVDIRLTGGAYNWLRANGARYGFYNSLPNDLPHWSATGR